MRDGWLQGEMFDWTAQGEAFNHLSQASGFDALADAEDSAADFSMLGGTVRGVYDFFS